MTFFFRYKLHKSVENYKCIYSFAVETTKGFVLLFLNLAIHVQGLACGYHILVSVRNKYVIYFDTPERTAIY